jgi:hypothetical protein
LSVTQRTADCSPELILFCVTPQPTFVLLIRGLSYQTVVFGGAFQTELKPRYPTCLLTKR